MLNKVGSVFKRKNGQKYSYPMRFFWLIFKYCEDEEVCKNEKSLKMMQFSNPFLFLQKWGFEERRKFDGTCNYQNCNLWSNPVIIHMAILKGVCIFADGVFDYYAFLA